MKVGDSDGNAENGDAMTTTIQPTTAMNIFFVKNKWRSSKTNGRKWQNQRQQGPKPHMPLLPQNNPTAKHCKTNGEQMQNQRQKGPKPHMPFLPQNMPTAEYGKTNGNKINKHDPF